MVKKKSKEQKIADELFRQIKTYGLYDDRREYDVEDFMSAYQISRKTALLLYKKFR